LEGGRFLPTSYYYFAGSFFTGAALALAFFSGSAFLGAAFAFFCGFAASAAAS